MSVDRAPQRGGGGAEGDTVLSLVSVWVAALVCLLFACTLRDTPARELWMPQSDAPELPADVGDRAAALAVTVLDEAGVPAEGVLLRVFSVVGDEVYLAASKVTGPDGRAHIPRLPSGETWVLAEKDGLARTSRRVVLEPGDRELELTLQAAETFEVVVVDPMQRPIRGVDVSLYSSDPLAHETKTDERGLARFTSLPPPPFAVEVVARGFDAKFIPKLTLDDSPLFVKLSRLGGLEIRVIDQAQKPVVGATVLVAGSTLWPARSAETNDAGRITVSGLPRGFYDIRAQQGHLISDTETGVLLADGEIKEVELVLIPGTSVTVTVTDGEAEDAPPIEGANVALVEGGVSSFPLYGRTNAGGVVVLGPIAGLDAAVSARAEGYVARSAVPLEEGQTEVQISLLRGGVVVGDVVDEDDYPVEGARLEVVGVDLDGMPIVESSDTAGFREDHFDFALPGATPLVPAGELGVMPVVPDIPFEMRGGLVVARTARTGVPWVSARDGTFTLSGVTPGRIRVVARHPGYVEGISEAVQLEPGGEADVRVVMRRGGVLEGRVLEQDRTPVAGARVEVAAVVGSLERITFTADDGSFAFAALPTEVVISVARPDAPEHIVERLTVDIPPDERREIEILLPEPRAPVLVRVLDDRGYPLGRVEVHASSLEPQTPLIKTLFTNDNGEAELLDARGLPLRFVISRRGYGPAASEIDPAPAVVDLTMFPGLNASGTVETKWGVVADAYLTLLTPTGADATRSDAEGAFTFRDLAPGPARLMVVAEGHVPIEIDVPIQGDGYRDDVDLGKIELDPAGTVKGTVVDENGDPVAGARIASGRVPTYLPLGELPVGIVAADRHGQFTLGGLAEGAHTIEAYKVGYGRSAAQVKVRANDTGPEIQIELVEDPEVDVTRVGAQASLAVTLSESTESGARVIVFEHVPLRGEAQRAGILAGDRFLACDGVPIRTLEQARRSLNGPVTEDFVVELGRPPDHRWRVRVRREHLRR